jgi:hypothetical protein
MTNGALLFPPLQGSAYQVRVKLVNEIGLPIHVNIRAGEELLKALKPYSSNKEERRSCATARARLTSALARHGWIACGKPS